MPDSLVRGLDKQLNIRFAAVVCTDLAAEAIRRHDADPAAAQVIAEAVSSCALTGVLLEENERYSVRWEYPGAIKGLLADTDAHGHVRCLPQNPHIMPDLADAEDIYGTADGWVSVIKSADGKILNSGKTAAPMASAATDLAFFFCASDQIETEISTIADFAANPEQPVKFAAGIMLQALPECDLNSFTQIRDRLHQAFCLQALRNSALPFETWLRQLLAAVFNCNINDVPPRFCYTLAAKPCFKCSCSKSKMLTSLKMLGKDELNKDFEEQHVVRVQCQFCRQVFEFNRDDFRDNFLL